MELDPRELHDLAGFFGRRFPDQSARDLAAAAGVPLAPSAGWTSLVTEAARLDRLPQLAAAARAARPGDPNMEELGRILAPNRRVPRSAVALAALGVLALAGALTVTRGPQAPEAPAPVEAAPVAAAPAVVEPPVAAPTPEAPVAAAVVEAPAAPEAPSPALSAAGAATVTGACRGAAGGVIGYFHAGSTSPGHQGQTITLARGARVRADYPDRHSNFNANAPIRCVLPPGSTVRLDAEPITVPGQAVWVPLVAGSVL